MMDVTVSRVVRRLRDNALGARASSDGERHGDGCVYYAMYGTGGENVPPGGKVPGVDLTRMVAGVCRGQKKERNSTYCTGIGAEGGKKRKYRGVGRV